MGYLVAMGICVVCRTPFTFNPHCVPSLRVKGVRQPICKHCHDWAQAFQNMVLGHPIWPPVLPNAYDVVDESAED